jgi:hypothetical protein
MKTYRISYDVYVELSADSEFDARKKSQEMIKKSLSEQQMVNDYHVYIVSIDERGL